MQLAPKGYPHQVRESGPQSSTRWAVKPLMCKDSQSIRLASLEEAPIIRAMLDRYLRELSALCGTTETNADTYPFLPAYWSEVGRYPYFILRGDNVAGFALIRGPESTGTGAYQVAEFFIEPSNRRSGLGRLAILDIWRELPGEWALQVHQENPTAVTFWLDCAQHAVSGAVSRSVSDEQGTDWIQLGFTV